MPLISTDSFDLDVLAKFVYELNICRRQIAAYPPGHPLIAQALDKAMEFLDQVLEFNPVLELGVAEDRLLLGHGVLESKNPVFKDFSRWLFSYHIATLRISWGVTRAQLECLCQVLSQKPQEVATQGGAAVLFSAQNAPNIVLTEVDYNAFATKELAGDTALGEQAVTQNQNSLWQRFILGMIEGNLSQEADANHCPVDPNWLATVINEHSPEENHLVWKQSYDATISSFVQELAAEQPSAEELRNFKTLIKGLNKPLRRQFLHSTFDASSAHPQVIRQLAGQLERDELVQLLGEQGQTTRQLPSSVLSILSTLTPGEPPSHAARVGGSNPLENDEKQRRLTQLLSQDRSENYVPPAYQALMEKIVQTPAVNHHSDDGRQLRAELELAAFEPKNLAILFQLLHLSDTLPYPALTTNITEHWHLAIETGEFDQLLFSHIQLSQLADSTTAHHAFCLEMLKHFEQRAFIRRLLAALALWGKPSHQPVRDLLLRIGDAAIPLLLEHLATESSRTLRQYYINTLVRFGARAVSPILELLDDHRWYYVRNLLIILRLGGQVVPLISLASLENHPHPRVWQELLALYRQAAPDRAETLLMEALDDPTHPQHPAALRQAVIHGSLPVINSLIQQLHAEPLCRETLSGKIDAIHALARIASPEALAALERLFFAKSLLHPRLHKQLRAAIHDILPGFPARMAPPKPATGPVDDREEDVS